MSGASLYVIHQTLQELHELRQQVADDGDLEAAAAVDQQIREWLDRSPEKVTSYVGLIRSRENTVAACKAERARIKAIEDAADADIERLKSNVLEAMQRFDIKELSAKPGGGFRRQGNGGLEPLDIPTTLALPIEHRIVTVTLTNRAWAALLNAAGVTAVETITSEIRPDADTIRAALKQRVVCPECRGIGANHNNSSAIPCERCEARGTISATVPGAKLLPRGENVRIK